MKTCKKCLTEKPLDQFYRHRAMTDGFLNFCKPCVLAKAKNHRIENLEQINERARARSRTAEGLEKNKLNSRKARAEGRSCHKNWSAKNRHKRVVHSKVQRAIKQGVLQRKPCQICGDIKSEAHHEDYSKPLEVKWLCRKHHAEIHRKYKDAA